MPQLLENDSSLQHVLAYALFDNIPDTPDELAFRKGDILMVLDRSVANIADWWLCSLKGIQGICPANRLRLLPNIYDIPHKDSAVAESSLRINARRLYDQVSVLRKCNDEINDCDMPNRCSPSASEHSQNVSCDYDVPPSRHAAVTSSLGCSRCLTGHSSCTSPITTGGDAYDVPRPHYNNNHRHLNELTPSSSVSSLTADSLSSSNRSSVVNIPDYDIPKPYAKGPHLMMQPSQFYDIPPQHNLKELTLDLNSALENLERLEGETTGAIKKLLGFVGPGWRTKSRLSETVPEIKLAVTKLQRSLNDLSEFGEGTLWNATKASDKNLALKLAPLVANLRKSYHTVKNSVEKLTQSNWNPEVLSISEALEDQYIPDALDTLISCSKALTEDIRQITSFIQGNGLLLFKKESGYEWSNDYDYVELNARNNCAQGKELQKNCYVTECHDDEVSLDSNDRNLLTFFAMQYMTHYKNLMMAIDALLNTVERNQPPKIFLAHGKFVALSAHKLVHIGDAVYRNIACKEIKERVLNCANALSDELTQSVAKTKQAALQFPTVTAVQNMVDSILDISHAANNLKMCLLQATVKFL